MRVDENGYPCTFEARNLLENQKYDFWVTASTSVGEGELKRNEDSEKLRQTLIFKNGRRIKGNFECSRKLIVVNEMTVS